MNLLFGSDWTTTKLLKMPVTEIIQKFNTASGNSNTVTNEDKFKEVFGDSEILNITENCYWWNEEYKEQKGEAK